MEEDETLTFNMNESESAAFHVRSWEPRSPRQLKPFLQSADQSLESRCRLPESFTTLPYLSGLLTRLRRESEESWRLVWSLKSLRFLGQVAGKIPDSLCH